MTGAKGSEHRVDEGPVVFAAMHRCSPVEREDLPLHRLVKDIHCADGGEGLGPKADEQRRVVDGDVIAGGHIGRAARNILDADDANPAKHLKESADARSQQGAADPQSEGDAKLRRLHRVPEPL